MLVKRILRSKSSQQILTISRHSSVKEAVCLLSQERIGALIVSDDGKSVGGIVSERDVVRELGRHGSSCLSMPVHKIMSTKIVTCSEEDTADQVLSRMTDGRFRHMPVVADAEMIGLISIGDVVKARLAELNLEKEALEGMIMGH